MEGARSAEACTLVQDANNRHRLGYSMKASKEVSGPGSMRNALAWAQECLGRILASGKTGRVIIESHDGPTAEMRGKFHAMCGDIARQVKQYRGATMDLERWKAVCIGAAIDQEWLPAWGGGGVVPFRKSSEHLSKKQYCDCIEVAYAIGSHFGVVWSDTSEVHSADSKDMVVP